MKTIDISYGEYAAKWGLSDFYDDSAEKLKAAMASGENFMTEYGCKKEIRYATIIRENNAYTIRVIAHMDDLWEEDDLIYDALWARLGIEEELSDEIIDSIRDAAIYDIDDHSTVYGEIPASATFEELCERIEELEDAAEEANTAMFNDLCDIVAEHYKWMKEEQTRKKGEEATA